MKKLFDQLLRRRRYWFAALAGFVLATAFPKINLAGAAWVAPGLILACAYGRTGGEAWRIGYVAGLTHWLVLLSWLLHIPVTGFPILGWIALAAFMAIYPAFWVWLLAGKIGHGSWLRRCFWSLGGAAAWVALEMIRLRLFTGFPWTPLGASQWQMTPLIQIASVVGVHGVTLLVVWVSLALYSSVLALLRHPTTRYIWLGEIILPTIVVLLIFNNGLTRLKNAPAPDTSLRVTFIQPAVPQTMIWDSAENTNRLNHLIALTETALTNETDLLLWPEAALSALNRETYPVIANLIQRHRVPMILSADDVQPKAQPTEKEFYDVFNAAFALTPENELLDVYHKRQLVIFGEYVPLENYLPFIKRLTPIGASYASGQRINQFRLAGHTLAPLICFEDAFPQHVRDHASAETDLLVNLTNDGWFGEGAAQWQQAAMSAFRAVENGLPLLRCCNNGITCWFDANGRMREIFRAANGSEYGVGFAHWEIPFVSAKLRGAATFYNRNGDWFGWSCVGVSAVLLLWRFKRKGPLPNLQAPSSNIQ